MWLGREVVSSKRNPRNPLVVQWIRIPLPMQGTWVQSLVWKDPICHEATHLVNHNYLA